MPRPPKQRFPLAAATGGASLAAMFAPRLGICLLLVAVGQGPAVVAADAMKLADSAKAPGQALPRGAIVTAEWKDGVVSYAAAGKLEPPGTPPERVIFEIGSISKVFTGLLLAQAVIEKKLRLDQTLQEVLGAKAKFSDPRVGAITLKQLATHTSGLPRLPDNLSEAGGLKDPYATYNRALLDQYLAGAKLGGDPPFEQSYSNLGVGLLGDLLARLQGKSWGQLVVEKIAQPLGMRDTAVALSSDQKKRFAPCYQAAEPVQAWNFDSLAGAGALHSTAADMILFGEALLHPEKTPIKDALLLLQQPQNVAGDIGLCLMIAKFGGRTVLEHNGGTHGSRSVFQAEPGTGSIRVVLSNNGRSEPERIAATVLGEKPRKKESGKILTQSQLGEYEGIYPLGAGARFTVLRRGDQLWTQLTGQTFLHLFPHENDDRFFLKIVAAEIQFNRVAGKVASLTLFQNGREQTAKKSADPAPKITFRSAKELAPYAGTYELAPKMDFTVKVADSTLFAKLTGQDFAPVFEKREDWFEYDVVDAALEFERDKDGKIVALKLHQNGLVQRAARKT